MYVRKRTIKRLEEHGAQSSEKSSPCLKLYEFNLYKRYIGRRSPIESGNLFLRVFLTFLSLSLSVCIPFSFSSASSRSKNTRPFVHLSPLSTNFPFGCPVWSALPAWLFAFASQNACVYYDFFFFFWIASMPAVRSVSLLSIRLTTKWYG